MAKHKLKLPPFYECELDTAELAALRARFKRRPLYGGPCIILCRRSGLALDAGRHPSEGVEPVLFPVHGLPWQSWLIRQLGKDVEIVSAHKDLALTIASAPTNETKVRLQIRSDADMRQRWRLQPTDDRSAFLIEIATGAFALDATIEPEPLKPPHLWLTHWESQQQWVIARLPAS